MSSHYGKRYDSVISQIDDEKHYTVNDAVSLFKNATQTKFVQTLDIALVLNIEKNPEPVRGVSHLKNGRGRDVKIAAFVKEEDVQAALSAGADYAGSDDLVQKILTTDFKVDWCIAKPEMMPTVGKVAKTLGPKGLMPNPKLGTVTTDIALTISNLKNSVSFRMDKKGVIHAGIGKLKQDTESIVENLYDFISSVVQAKPQTIKGVFIKKAYLSTTMSPSIKLDLVDLLKKI